MPDNDLYLKRLHLANMALERSKTAFSKNYWQYVRDYLVRNRPVLFEE